MSFFPSRYTFSVAFNGERLPDFILAIGTTADVEFSNVTVRGHVVVTFMGFTEPGSIKINLRPTEQNLKTDGKMGGCTVDMIIKPSS